MSRASTSARALIAVTTPLGRCARCGAETVRASHLASPRVPTDRLCLDCGWASTDQYRERQR